MDRLPFIEHLKPVYLGDVAARPEPWMRGDTDAHRAHKRMELMQALPFIDHIETTEHEEGLEKIMRLHEVTNPWH